MKQWFVKLISLMLTIVPGLMNSCANYLEFNPAQPMQNIPGIGEYDSLELITVPGGSNFIMGYTGVANAEPEHTIPEMSSFKIGKYEITGTLWFTIKAWAMEQGYIFQNSEIQEETPGTGPIGNISRPDCLVWCNALSEHEELTPCYYTTPALTIIHKDTTDTRAITTDCVNWEAEGYRLPTEAEWEYAARYEDGTSFTPGDVHSGHNIDPNVDACAWYMENSGDQSHPGGARKANSLGIFDLSGNVAEWVWDFYGEYTNSAPYTDPNPRGPVSGTQFINRGGGFESAKIELSISAREMAPDTSPAIGLRVARSFSE